MIFSPIRLVTVIVAAVALLPGGSFAQLSSTVVQSGANDSVPNALATNGASGAGDTVPITGTTDAMTGLTNPAANPFTFDGGEVAALSAIFSIQITLTIFNGDTGAAEVDFDNLTLGLDGFDTGIKLNGFNSVSGDDVRLTLTSFSIMNAVPILLALQADNMLAATIIDSTGLPDSNGMVVPSADALSAPITATLAINVPEPATTGLLIFGAAFAGVVAWRRRPARPS